MGRPRKPTAVAKERGKLDGHQRSIRDNELEVNEELGPPPGSWTKEQKKAWADFVAKPIPGVLKRGDEELVEIAVVLKMQFRKDPVKFNKISQLVSTLEKLGMSPIGRTYLKNPPKSVGKVKTRNRSVMSSLRAGERPR